MKSIIFLLLLLSLSIFAYIKQDELVDVLVGEEKNQEVQIENNIKIESESESRDEFLDFQNSRSLDDDFNSDLAPETNDKIIETQLEMGRENQLIQEILSFKNFESQALNLTYYDELNFVEVERSLIDIIENEQKVGEITLIENIQESSIESYFKNQSFDLIQDANNQGVYIDAFEQSFFEETFKLVGFKGLKYYDYYFFRKNTEIVMLKIESKSRDLNFEKVIISSLRLK